MEKLISVAEAATLIGVRPKSVYQMVKDGRLRGTKIAKHVFLDKEEVIKFAAAWKKTHKGDDPFKILYE